MTDKYNLFDYESGTLTEISLNTVHYQHVEVTQDGKDYYYIGNEGKYVIPIILIQRKMKKLFRPRVT